MTKLHSSFSVPSAICRASSLMCCSASGSDRALAMVEMHLYHGYERDDAVVSRNLVLVSERLKR